MSSKIRSYINRNRPIMAMFVKRARSCCCCYDGDADREDGSVSPLWLQSLVGEQKRDETKAARSHGLSVPPTSWPAIESCLMKSV